MVMGKRVSEELKKHLKNISPLGVRARNRMRQIEEKKQKEKLFLKLKKDKNKVILSRLCGFIAGDGTLSIRNDGKNMHYDLRFYPDDLYLAKIFVDTFFKLYDKYPRIKKTGNFYTVDVCSKLACNHLKSVSSFGTLSWIIPSNLFISNKSKIEFIRAFFDCEAYVSKSKNVIQVQSVNKSGLYSLMNLLEEFGIICKMYTYERKNKNWNTNYLLTILGKENVIKFARLIGFNHSIKQTKLLKLAGMAKR